MDSGAFLSVNLESSSETIGAFPQHAPPSDDSTNPSASVCLVAYNGLPWLPGCLASLRSQDSVDYELLIVDCGSTDGSAEFLAQESAADTRVRFLKIDRNLGYAAAQNVNIRAARSECVVLMNQDVELHASFLSVVIEALLWRPAVGSVQGLVSRLDGPGKRIEVVDTTGLVMARDRRVTSRDQGLEISAVTRRAGRIWGVDGPVAAFRRSALNSAALHTSGGELEYYDEDFFMYKEDVDLAWRLRRLGWPAWYEPAARAWHGRTADGPAGGGWRDIVARNRVTPAWIRALSWRNHRLMQIKNDDPAAFLRDLPWIARREILAAGYIALADPARLAAVPGLLRLIPSALRKRRELRHRAATRRSAMSGGAER